MRRIIGSSTRSLALWLAIPFAVAASPSPSAMVSPMPADAVALPDGNGAWLVTVTVGGGRIARFKQYVVASDGHAASTPTGPVVLDAAALARVADAVTAAHATRWSIPTESTCCDRVITSVELALRSKHARTTTSRARNVQGGTLLPADAGTLVDVVESAFAPSPAPTH